MVRPKRNASARSSRRTAAAKRTAEPDIYEEMLADAGVSVARQSPPQRPPKRRRPDAQQDVGHQVETPSGHEPRQPALQESNGDRDSDGDEASDEDVEFEDVLLPAPTVQTMERESDDDDDDDDDGDDDDGDDGDDDDGDDDDAQDQYNREAADAPPRLHNPAFAAPLPDASPSSESSPHLELNLTAHQAAASPLKRQAERRKPLTGAERECRVNVHKAHLVCLLSHVARRNDWCNDARAQEALRPHLSDQTVRYLTPSPHLPQFGQAESLKNGLKQSIEMWRAKFVVTERGIRRALWAEDVAQLQDNQMHSSHSSHMASSSGQLLAAVEGVSASSFANEEERIQARDALFEALRRVQSPWDIVWEHNWVNTATNASVKTLIDAGVFTKWAEQGHGPQTSAQLAELVGLPVEVIRRMLRQISGQHLVTETAEDTFAPTTWARALAEDEALPSIYGNFYSELMVPMFVSLPSFLRHKGYRNPTDVTDSNWQFRNGTQRGFFDDLNARPDVASHFHDAMRCHSRYNLAPWPDVYPTETIVEAGRARPERVLVVDVGGSRGHDLEKFLARHPGLADGSLVLQDLPEVVRHVRLPSAIRPQEHDFFTEQPVEGARAYFMHNVLHDWADDKAAVILDKVARAMERGYSRLLIHESLISAVKPLARVTTSDITMMACLSAHERDEEEWRALIARAGLRVVNIWRRPQSVESVIEAELA
ncbi:hypothetical protein E4U42_006563 [Claviceps africana]|uniref:O-methyltransferase C-terminal domain-containing protein n=1 Tax=Claviceps africana TaxID=83212 RepID=A0A8K0J350_9HYPO|nr:hypothetical protein E4U42_006563 [Claviceps africana]